MKKHIGVFLKLISLLMTVCLSFTAFNCAYAYDNTYLNNTHWHEYTTAQLQSKFHASDRFITVICSELSSASSSFGNGLLTEWMNGGTDIYGISFDTNDSNNGNLIPEYVWNTFGGTTLGDTLVVFSESGETKGFSVTDSSSLTELQNYYLAYSGTTTTTPTSIAVKDMPAKTLYKVGEALDTTGLSISVYSGGSISTTVYSGFTCSGFSSAKEGSVTVTVTYNGKSAYFSVNVSNSCTYDFNVTYYQTDARATLDDINNLRKNDPWYWNSDNKTKTVNNNLQPLSYDYDLEKAAMQRAAELLLYYSHTRTDGTGCFTAVNNYGAIAENIAVGYSNADAFFNAWLQASMPYEQQGHRRNMLSGEFTAVGIACAEYNGQKCCIQILRSPTVNTVATAPTDGSAAVKCNVLDTLIQSSSFTCSESAYYLEKNMTAALPSLSGKIMMLNDPKLTVNVVPEAVWQSSNTSVVTVSGGYLTAVGSGSANIYTSVAGKTISVPVNVNVLTDATVVLEKTTYEYDGTAHKPTVKSVTLADGTVLLRSDFTVTYADNTASGTAKVIITATGNYSGTVTVNFEIVCAHTYDSTPFETKAAGCTEDGYRHYKCTKCGNIRNEIIPATGHNWNEGVITTAVTCTVNGVKTFTCLNCGETKTEIIPALGHIDADGNGICDRCSTVLNPTYSAVLYARGGSVDYRTKTTFTATATGVNGNCRLVIYEGSKLLKTGTNTSVTYDFGELKGTENLTVKIVDGSGNTQKDSAGNALSKNVTISVDSGFFAKLVAFFRGIFGALPTENIRP